MDKKSVIVKLDNLFWGLEYLRRYKDSVKVYTLILALKRAETVSNIRAWVRVARRVIGEIR